MLLVKKFSPAYSTLFTYLEKKLQTMNNTISQFFKNVYTNSFALKIHWFINYSKEVDIFLAESMF